MVEGFFIFGLGGSVGVEEFAGEDVDGGDDEEDGEENFPGNVKASDDEDANENDEGEEGVVVATEKKLTQG